MAISSEARIYLANQRGIDQEDWFRTYHTFNFGSYQHVSRQSFHSLLSLDDETLAASRTRYYSVSGSETIIVLPLTGRLEYQYGSASGVVDVGQIVCLPGEHNTLVGLTNPYKRELINFLQIRVAAISTTITVDAFNLADEPNGLIPLLKNVNTNCALFIAKFDGRKELAIELRRQRLFAFVIEGAFELEGRLIQSRDGLAVWNTHSAEIEALSKEAIVLIAIPC